MFFLLWVLLGGCALGQFWSRYTLPAFDGLLVVNDSFATVDLYIFYLVFDLHVVGFASILSIGFAVEDDSERLLLCRAYQFEAVAVPEDDLELVVVYFLYVFVLFVVVLVTDFACLYVYVLSVAEYYHLLFQTYSVVYVQLAGLNALTGVLEHVYSLFYCDWTDLAGEDL